MFKKKHYIPPRPKPPVAEQVVHDLNAAPEDDVVFMLGNSTSGKYGIRSQYYNLAGCFIWL
jgi:hypothetical protein